MKQKLFVILVTMCMVIQCVPIGFVFASSEEGSTTEEVALNDTTEDITEEPAEEDSVETEATESETTEDVSEEVSVPEDLRFEDGDIGVSVTYDEGFSETAVLNIEEIDKSDEAYDSYIDEIKSTIGSDSLAYVKLYDVSVVDESDQDIHYQPENNVEVKIEQKDLDAETEYKIVHFAEDKTEELDVVNDEGSLTFETDSFSVYAIVEGIYVEDPDDRNIHTVEEIDGKDAYIYGILNNTYYAKDEFITVKNTRCLTRSTNNESEGVLYHFTKVPGTENQFYIQHSETNQYLCMNNTGNMSFDANTGTEFTIEYFNDGVEEVFYIYRMGNNNQKYCINMKGGDNAVGGFGGSTYKDNGSRILLLLPEEGGTSLESDPYGLNNQTYGIVLDGSNMANPFIAAVQNNFKSSGKLASLRLQKRPNPSDQGSEVLYVPEKDVSFWTFQWVDRFSYYISTEVDGQTKYLSLGNNSSSLVDEPNEDCIFEVQSSEAHEGKYRFVNNGKVLTLSGKNVSNGFCGYLNNMMDSEYDWYNLIDKTDFSDEDFAYRYCAHKISVSDEDITNGSQVIVYTRIWDDNEKRYRFYLIDHDGTLIECSNVGSEIWWQAGPIETFLWDFTEYYYEGTTNPNFYYELQNQYSEKYLAPQLHSGGQLLSDNPIGININGRRYGDYYSKILSWDDPNYDYAGLAVKNGQLVVTPMAHAGEFYFATLEEDLDTLTTIDTVDNDDYGIKMKMKKYTGTIYGSAKNRNQEQTDVLGSDLEAYEELVTKELGDDGYPIALNTNQSLAALFADGIPVNHLFSSEKYHESGYFEYDCTQNYAYLNGNNFDVYNAIGSFDTKGKSSQHGQFMPYDDLTPGYFSTGNYNVTDVINNDLPDSDPRKGMSLYCVDRKTAHYFFGMEMTADFMQTPSGEDQFGHDLIFEFSGDDDMWLYLDGELILDLGGVHSAFTGNINYKTGTVHIDRSAQDAGIINTTLRDIFEDNYRSKNPTASNAEVNAYLDEIFDGNTFKDYTAHSMKMLYMERGAGSSNLRMRFNLTTVKDGQVLLQKKLSGTDKQDYLSVEFPYRAYYRENAEDEWHVYKQGLNDKYGYNITYGGETIPVKTNADGTIFYLKPSETAELHFESDDVEYRVAELNVDTAIYDRVYINDEEAPGTEHDGLYDFGLSGSKVGLRKELTFTNHVSEEAIRSLIVTKRLFDEQGNPLSKEDDPTPFRFRVCLGKDDNGQYEYYRLGSYYVKDEHNNYCKYIDGTGFVSIGKTSLRDVTDEELTQITFTTSPSGAVDKIPANYSVEITGLMVDTAFKVEEQPSEIPKGYSFDSYHRVAGTYIIEDGDTENSGIIRDNSNPHVEIYNNRGFGLTAKKVWTDDTFMASHDTIYLGVFYNGNLISNTLREYTKDTSSLYWYFDRLAPGARFEDYIIREVKLTDPHVNEDGYVTSYTDMEVVDEGDTIVLNAKSLLGNDWENLDYVVNYEQGDLTGVSDNLRVDEVTNVADGLRIVKTDMQGNYISGGTFTLKNSEGRPIGSETYTANSTGLITTAYLPEGTYTLSEIASPPGYHRLIDDVIITSGPNGKISVSGSDYVSLEEVAGLQEIQIKNRKNEFSVYKMDETFENPLPGTVFALYKEVNSNAGKRKDFRPVEGYENLVVGSDGKIPLVDITLKPGTYYLEERSPVNGYIKGDDIKFTVSVDYVISLDSETDDALLEVDRNNPNQVEYVIKIKNRAYNRVQLKKTDTSGNTVLSNAVFDLYKASDFNAVTGEVIPGRAALVNGTTNTEGTLSLGSLPNGSYYLKEIASPSGYQLPSEAIKVDVSSDGVRVSGSDLASVNKVGDIYEIQVKNVSSNMVPTGIDSYIPVWLLVVFLGWIAVHKYVTRKGKD